MRQKIDRSVILLVHTVQFFKNWSHFSKWSSGFGLQDLVRLFSKTDIFGTTTEKERGCYIQVLMNGHFLFLKQPNKIFEAKLAVCEFYFFY